MSLNDLMISDVADVFMQTEDFAEQIIRYVGGDVGHIKHITGIVTWYPTVPEMNGGRATRRRGEVMLSSDVEISVTDALKIGEDRAEVEAVGPSQDGAQVVYVVQQIPQTKGAAPLRTGGF
jgi:hypothetical protein